MAGNGFPNPTALEGPAMYDASRMASLPQALIDRVAYVGRFVGFALRSALAAPFALRRPGSLVAECERIALGSLLLVLAAAVSLGVVSWLQGRLLLSEYQLETQLPGVVAIFVTVGVGPVLTALVVAGQVGARLGAELGSMKVTEQLDALEAMGVSPLRTLAATRVLACTLMLPLLNVVLVYAALAASAAAEWLGGSIPPEQYARGLVEFLTLDNVVPATASSLLFGFLIGATGCWCGFRAGQGTEGVGRASTYGVVGSMVLVLVANVFWVRITERIFL